MFKYLPYKENPPSHPRPPTTPFSPSFFFLTTKLLETVYSSFVLHKTALNSSKSASSSTIHQICLARISSDLHAAECNGQHTSYLLWLTTPSCFLCLLYPHSLMAFLLFLCLFFLVSPGCFSSSQNLVH